MIELKDVTFQQQKHIILNRLSFVFPKQQFILVTGDSGSGKSTLFRLIAGFAQLSYTGKILLDGKNLATASMKEKAQTVGMVFQNPSQQFTMRTLRKEIIFALENLGLAVSEINRRMNHALALGETSHLADREINQLSGGERQRAALTVILAIDAPILILDEPFASIDSESRLRLIQKLKQLRNQGKTIILSDHDWLGYQEVVDQVVELTKGKLHTCSLDKLDATTCFYLHPSKDKRPPFFDLQKVQIQRNKQLLLETSWQLNKGITTLTGANGAGKTSLLKAMSQLEKYRGKMFLNGKKLRKKRQLYQTMSLVVQDAAKQFVTLTVQEELLFSKNQNPEIRAKQQEALAYFKIDGTQSLFHLSEGQKKIVQLISMLSLDLEFLLLDEPFAGLDQKACRYFVEWIQEQSNQQDFLIVTHRLAPLAGISHHHIVLEKQALQVGERS
ncbi:energy-coupling factor transport system ATP-binding protein [Enterococcus sp. DIV2402]|uniref:Energy-coupling factor transport system ATP-binding protein n=1 Tax=Candidatus Enterococcus lowellii TaxID=2230877 RepID=A0ABZ2SIG3_9ENTE|nr:ABC transporter ATP-binding protein [Enterococcus sp. DIV2402]MBO0464739.1 ABC transporter ATP-binding protein [Enterococcus sp. DIV2402]